MLSASIIAIFHTHAYAQVVAAEEPQTVPPVGVTANTGAYRPGEKNCLAAAATQAWGRMAHEIEQQKPEVLVFNGGMMERGTYVLPVPGN